MDKITPGEVLWQRDIKGISEKEASSAFEVRVNNATNIALETMRLNPTTYGNRLMTIENTEYGLDSPMLWRSQTLVHMSSPEGNFKYFNVHSNIDQSRAINGDSRGYLTESEVESLQKRLAEKGCREVRRVKSALYFIKDVEREKGGLKDTYGFDLELRLGGEEDPNSKNYIITLNGPDVPYEGDPSKSISNAEQSQSTDPLVIQSESTTLNDEASDQLARFANLIYAHGKVYEDVLGVLHEVKNLKMPQKQLIIFEPEERGNNKLLNMSKPTPGVN